MHLKERGVKNNIENNIEKVSPPFVQTRAARVRLYPAKLAGMVARSIGSVAVVDIRDFSAPG